MSTARQCLWVFYCAHHRAATWHLQSRGAQDPQQGLVLGLCSPCPWSQVTSGQSQIQPLEGPRQAAQRKEEALFQGREEKSKQSKTTLEQPQGKRTSATVGREEMGPSMGQDISAGIAEGKCLEEAQRTLNFSSFQRIKAEIPALHPPKTPRSPAGFSRAGLTAVLLALEGFWCSFADPKPQNRLKYNSPEQKNCSTPCLILAMEWWVWALVATPVWCWWSPMPQWSPSQLHQDQL